MRWEIGRVGGLQGVMLGSHVNTTLVPVYSVEWVWLSGLMATPIKFTSVVYGSYARGLFEYTMARVPAGSL